MTGTGDEDTVVIAKARVERALDVLSLAVVGAFTHEDATIREVEDDDFGVLEQTLNILLDELAGSRRKNEETVAELRGSEQALKERLEIIEAQRLEIRRLSTPLLEIWDRVLVLPVIGVVDGGRAADLTAALLAGVAERGADSVIIDVTGLASLDRATAEVLLKLSKAAGLLGATCVLTGISPQSARVLVDLGASFRGVRTCASLKDGLRVCLDRRGASRGGEL
jgi:rsbT co-antagonist protein RsbR